MVKHTVSCQLRLLMEDPHIALIDGFATKEECEYLIERYRDQAVPSVTIGDDGVERPSPRRTSRGCFLSVEDDPLLQELSQRIERLTLWPTVKTENPNFLHYRPGEEFKPHCDFFAENTLVERHGTTGGQRIATVVLYLNDTDGEGATVFDRLGLSITPRLGTLLFFSYPMTTPDSLTLHSSLATHTTDKFVLVSWFREGYTIS